MKSMYETVRCGLNVEPDSEDFVYAFAESVLYVSGAVSAFAYQEYVKPFCSAMSAKVFRLSLQDQRYTNLDIKLFSLKLAHQKVSVRAEVNALAKEFSISANDAMLIHMLYTENPWFKRELNKASRKVKATNPLMDLKEIDSLFSRIYPSILKYIKFQTRKKLKFLVSSCNEAFEDFHSALSSKVVQAFYSLLPVQATELHIVNYLKRAVHNAVVNIIKSRTSQKSGRLVNSGTDKNANRQHTLLCVSQNQMEAFDADGQEVDIFNVDNESHSKFELTHSITEVLDSVKHSKKKYQFVGLLLGVEDESFTKWLRSEGICSSSEDNVDVQSRTTAHTFNEYVADFLNVSYRTAEVFLGQLKDMVGA